MKNRRQIILDTMSDLISNFLYYDRKEDEDLPVGGIEEAIIDKEITIEELSILFEQSLNSSVFKKCVEGIIPKGV